jgi:hypothetical protein
MKQGDHVKVMGIDGFYVFLQEVQGTATLRVGSANGPDKPTIAIAIDRVVSLEKTNWEYWRSLLPAYNRKDQKKGGSRNAFTLFAASARTDLKSGLAPHWEGNPFSQQAVVQVGGKN